MEAACVSDRVLGVTGYVCLFILDRRKFVKKGDTISCILFPHISTGFLMLKQNEVHFQNRVFRRNNRLDAYTKSHTSDGFYIPFSPFYSLILPSRLEHES